MNSIAFFGALVAGLNLNEHFFMDRLNESTLPNELRLISISRMKLVRSWPPFATLNFNTKIFVCSEEISIKTRNGWLVHKIRCSAFECCAQHLEIVKPSHWNDEQMFRHPLKCLSNKESFSISLIVFSFFSEAADAIFNRFYTLTTCIVQRIDFLFMITNWATLSILSPAKSVYGYVRVCV